ncbi:alpha-glucosidase [Blautia schinkii]|uniref:glycoside hydrolase family 13 protein n=1 Tax=Blautia schinkii TaxID=180164 RepID=UPI0015705456|nr:alpha-glucosidase [Blautia schinkii]NSG81160.1 alpha-glucosidase [Blautia schinkii]NSK21759.1 alpha-glucosidase [Blautia schinkii]NSK24802.1 alpha-glucosidase [Blautia schinkii]NSK31384.1 alpha-glucosidase [Blautia schinkii]NSK48183.1 alpha-glucosidase [Blautia schinkii]
MKKWWHDKVVYQIYPKSFYDSNGDGIGDIPGIISKLDYLKELGADILWLSPVYKSPLADQGYDIADYYAIDPRFGTMKDMDCLIAEAKKRDMYILMDLVVNHCSDEHEWFQKAVQDPEGKYGNFFYIEDKKDDRTPCNWRSYFGGSVWEELPGHSDKQYLHLFHKKQPDLNWENPEVREEVFKNIRWWMEKGLGGFRIDAIINIKKKLPFQDYPADRSDGMCSVERMLEDADGIGEFLSEMAEKCFHPYDAFTVGEVFNEKEDEICDFIGEKGYFSSMFDFEETCYGKSEDGWYASKYVLTPEDYKKCIFHTQQKIGETGLISNIIENHDEPRGVCHYILPEDRCPDSKKLLAGVYFFLRGIPFIYQGQEIGMENMDFTSMEQIDDISTIDEYKVALNAGCTEKEALQAASAFSRDNARTPVQWNKEKNAGFTTGTPWLEVNPDYKEINVESQLTDSNSLLSFYKKMTALRKTQEYKDTFVYGSFKPYKEDQENLIAYTRTEEKNILVMGNLQSQSRNVELPGEVKNVLLNNQEEVQIKNGTISLNPYQFVILEY